VLPLAQVLAGGYAMSRGGTGARYPGPARPDNNSVGEPDDLQQTHASTLGARNACCDGDRSPVSGGNS